MAQQVHQVRGKEAQVDGVAAVLLVLDCGEAGVEEFEDFEPHPMLHLCRQPDCMGDPVLSCTKGVVSCGRRGRREEDGGPEGDPPETEMEANPGSLPSLIWR